MQKIPAVHGITSDLLNPGAFAFFKDHPIEEFVTLLYANVFSDYVVNMIIRIKHFHLNVKQSRFAFDSYKIPRLFVEQFTINVNLHV